MRLLERKSPMGENRKRDREGEDSVAGLSVLLCGDGERLPTRRDNGNGLWCGQVSLTDPDAGCYYFVKETSDEFHPFLFSSVTV